MKNTLLTIALLALASPLYAQVTTISGSTGNNVAAPSTTKNVPVLPSIACSSAQLYTAGRIVYPCTDLFGAKWVTIRNSDGTPAVLAEIVDPAQYTVGTTTAFSVTTDTVIISATAAKKNYITALTIVAGAAEIVSITEGTGAVCGTSEVALAGSTTDANGMSFAANGGVPLGTGQATILWGKSVNVDTCLNVSGANRVSGFVTWVQAP